MRKGKWDNEFLRIGETLESQREEKKKIIREGGKKVFGKEEGERRLKQ